MTHRQHSLEAPCLETANSTANRALLAHSTPTSGASAGHSADISGAGSENTRSIAGFGEFDEMIVRVACMDRSDRTGRAGTHRGRGNESGVERTREEEIARDFVTRDQDFMVDRVEHPGKVYRRSLAAHTLPQSGMARYMLTRMVWQRHNRAARPATIGSPRPVAPHDVR